MEQLEGMKDGRRRCLEEEDGTRPNKIIENGKEKMMSARKEDGRKAREDGGKGGEAGDGHEGGEGERKHFSLTRLMQRCLQILCNNKRKAL